MEDSASGDSGGFGVVPDGSDLCVSVAVRCLGAKVSELESKLEGDSSSDRCPSGLFEREFCFAEVSAGFVVFVAGVGEAVAAFPVFFGALSGDVDVVAGACASEGEVALAPPFPDDVF